MTMYPEPTFEELLDWAEGRLGDEAAREIARRVEHGDEGSLNALRWIREFQFVSAGLQLVGLPAGLHPRLRAIFTSYGADTEAVVAEPSFDSRVDHELVGVRAAASGRDEMFQLAFRAGDVDVVLEVSPDADGLVRLDGQVLAEHQGTGAPQGTVHWIATLMQPGDMRPLSMVDDLGCFAIGRVSPGAVRLVLDNGQRDIVLALDLRPTQD